jgi:hypothetical protein
MDIGGMREAILIGVWYVGSVAAITVLIWVWAKIFWKRSVR